MTDTTAPFDDRDAEGLTQILGSFQGTLPMAYDIIRREIIANPRARDEAIAAMHKWKDQA